MAEVLLEPINLKSNATAISNARRIFYGKTRGLNVISTVVASSGLIKYTGSSIFGSALVNGKFVKVVKSNSALNGTATIPKTTYVVRKYVKGSLLGKAQLSVNAHKYKTVQSDLNSHSSLETYIYDRDIRESMMQYLPPIYHSIYEFKHLIAAEANEFTRLNAKLEELLLQFNVGTATYSLADWEKFTEVKKRRNTTSARRNAVMRRINGMGTITPPILKAVVDEYYDTEMIEVPEPGIIQFKFKKRGRLEGVDEIKEEVLEIIPAHLKPVFDFTFMPWRELDMIRRPWREVSKLTFSEISNMKWRNLEGTGIKWKDLENFTFKQIEASYDLNKFEEVLQYEQ